MAFQAVANVLKIVFSGATAARNWANIIHALYTGAAPSSAAITTYAGALAAAWNATMSPFQDTTTALNKVEVTDLTTPTSGQGQWEGEHLGTRAGDFLPAQAAALVSYPLLARYRGGHSRQYLVAGCFPDLLDQQHWVDPFPANLATAWGSVLGVAASTPIGVTPVSSLGIVSYRNATLLTPPPKYYEWVGEPVVSAQLATQRRRVRRTAHR